MLSLSIAPSLLLLSSFAPSTALAFPGSPPVFQSYTPIFSSESTNKLSTSSSSSSSSDASANSNNFVWADTTNIFAFGDSYTKTGWDVTAGVNSSDPGATSANGPNWIETLVSTYAVNTSISLKNFAYGGATIDKELVSGDASIRSVADQVALFTKYLASSPAEAPWTPENSLFVCFIGINDVVASYVWSNTTYEAFYEKEHERLLSLLSSLKSTTSTTPLNFLLLTLPNVARTPLILSQGAPHTLNATAAVKVYNDGLTTKVAAGLRKAGSWVGVFDTGAVFDALLDNASALGYNNATGYNELYEGGTETPTTQIAGFPPVSSYFWLNSLHPTWSVHIVLAHAVSTFLGAY